MVAFRVKCRDDIHLNTYLKNIIEFGGEGAILRKTESIYESGRTSSLIKLKVGHFKYFIFWIYFSKISYIVYSRRPRGNSGWKRR